MSSTISSSLFGKYLARCHYIIAVLFVPVFGIHRHTDAVSVHHWIFDSHDVLFHQIQNRTSAIWRICDRLRWIHFPNKLKSTPPFTCCKFYVHASSSTSSDSTWLESLVFAEGASCYLLVMRFGQAGHTFRFGRGVNIPATRRPQHSFVYCPSPVA